MSLALLLGLALGAQASSAPKTVRSVPEIAAAISRAAGNIAARPLTVSDGVVSVPASAIAGLVRLPDQRLAAFIERSARTHGRTDAPGATSAATPADHLRELRLVAAMTESLRGLTEQAIAELPPEDVERLARRAWDKAQAPQAAEAPRATTARYGRLFLALKYYMAGKGYDNALRALEFARERHSGTRKDGLTPEFQHQIEIALYLTTLRDLPDEETTLTAALLHDVMEDYDVSREELAARFGAEVERVVWLLTKVYRGEKKDARLYFAAIAEDRVASLVKGSDRINNVQSMIGVFSVAKQKEYIEEVERWFLPMLKSARKRFPEQAKAYFNIEHMLKSQLQLIKALQDF